MSAPPQRQVVVPPERVDVVAQSTAPAPIGLSKYFPTLRRNQTEAPKVASTGRFTWFGLRPKAGGTQVYTTDARVALNRPSPEPTALPVALQVPSDPAVTPTGGEAELPPESPSKPTASPTASTTPVGADPLAEAPAQVPDFGGTPSKPGEDEVNPLPPAAEPASPVVAAPPVVNRMPALPAIDPRERPQLASPQPVQPSPAFDAAPEPNFGKTGDQQAVKAVPQPADPNKPAEAPVPAMYSTHHHSAKAQKTVFASPQVAPTPQAQPSPQAKPTPQGLASPQSCEETTCQYHKWKKPCFCKLFRKMFKQGEYATPPVTMAH